MSFGVLHHDENSGSCSVGKCKDQQSFVTSFKTLCDKHWAVGFTSLDTIFTRAYNSKLDSNHIHCISMSISLFCGMLIVLLLRKNTQYSWFKVLDSTRNYPSEMNEIVRVGYISKRQQNNKATLTGHSQDSVRKSRTHFGLWKHSLRNNLRLLIVAEFYPHHCTP